MRLDKIYNLYKDVMSESFVDQIKNTDDSDIRKRGERPILCFYPCEDSTEKPIFLIEDNPSELIVNFLGKNLTIDKTSTTSEVEYYCHGYYYFPKIYIADGNYQWKGFSSVYTENVQSLPGYFNDEDEEKVQEIIYERHKNDRFVINIPRVIEIFSNPEEIKKIFYYSACLNSSDEPKNLEDMVERDLYDLKLNLGFIFEGYFMGYDCIECLDNEITEEEIIQTFIEVSPEKYEKRKKNKKIS